jgi:hypothetical protein
MPGRPAHFNYLRLIGRLEAIHKVQKHPTAFLVHVDVDGDATKIVAWPNTTVVTNAESWYLGSRLTEGGRNHATDG